MTGMEALVRWQHPRRGLLSPVDFVTVAEDIGVISTIDLWVLEQACATLAQWRRLPNGADLKMSVNISGQRLLKRGLKDAVLALLEQYQLPSAALCLELTESVLMDDLEGSVCFMENFDRVGSRSTWTTSVRVTAPSATYINFPSTPSRLIARFFGRFRTIQKP